MPTFEIEMLWRCSRCKAEVKGRHKSCTGCGKAKAGEPFYDSNAPETFENRVTDEALIKQALAGSDWQCKFCASHQRRDDGNCAECGADQGESKDTVTKWNDGTTGASGSGTTLEEDLRAQDKEDRKHQPQHTAQPRKKRTSDEPVVSTVSDADVTPIKRDFSYLRRGGGRLLAIVSIVAAFVTLGYFLFRTRVIDARVTNAEWAHIVHVERYRPVNGAGFHGEIPADAYDTTSVGERHHHYDQVQTGTKTVFDRVACGQDCSTTPKSCRTTSVKCKSNKNGFKSCSGGDKVCTGGDRVCTTKYCPKPREVPVYTDVSVKQPYFEWKVWRWTHDRDITERGTNSEPAWPSDKKINIECCGLKERSTRSWAYTITFTDSDGDTHSYTPSSESEFNSLKVGTKRKVKTSIVGPTEVLAR